MKMPALMKERRLLKGIRSMHSFMRRSHNKMSSAAPRTTKGLVLNGGWRYDLGAWFTDTFLFRGQWQGLRKRTVEFARVQPGQQVLDVGCGTGTLAMAAQRRVGKTGRVVGIDPVTEQIARARAKATRRHLPIDFQVGVIEHLPFPDQTFDVVFSTLMMHHLPAGLKRQGLAEIVRVLKPGGCLVIVDFTGKAERQGRATHFHAGGSRVQDLVTLVKDAGLGNVEVEETSPLRFSSFPGAALVRAGKN